MTDTEYRELTIPAAAKLQPGDQIRIIESGWELVETELPPRPALADCAPDERGIPTQEPDGWAFVFLADYSDGAGPVATAGWLAYGRFVCYDAESLAAGFRDHIKHEAEQ